MYRRFQNTYKIIFAKLLISTICCAQKLPKNVTNKIPAGMKVSKIVSGYLDNGKQKDYFVVLQSKIDSASHTRPLIVSINNQLTFYNENVIWPFGLEKNYDALAGISITNGKVYIKQYIAGSLGPGANIVYYVFSLQNNRLKLTSKYIYDHLDTVNYRLLPFRKQNFSDFNYLNKE